MIIEKPWGILNVFAQTPFYQGKVLTIRKGEATSLQTHSLRHTSIYLDDGVLLVHHNGVKKRMEVGDKADFIPSDVYRLVALEDSKIIEVSTPQTHDKTIIEDRYGRNESD